MLFIVTLVMSKPVWVAVENSVISLWQTDTHGNCWKHVLKWKTTEK